MREEKDAECNRQRAREREWRDTGTRTRDKVWDRRTGEGEGGKKREMDRDGGEKEGKRRE